MYIIHQLPPKVNQKAKKSKFALFGDKNFKIDVDKREKMWYNYMLIEEKTKGL